MWTTRLVRRYPREVVRLLALCAVLGLLAASCVNEEEEPRVSSTPIVGPSGGRAWVIECENRRTCFWKAGRLCKFGYDIVDKGHTTTGASYGGTRIGRSVVGHVSEEGYDELTIECRQ